MRDHDSDGDDGDDGGDLLGARMEEGDKDDLGTEPGAMPSAAIPTPNADSARSENIEKPVNRSSKSEKSPNSE